MIIYFIKSTLILAIVLGAYLLFLEREKMHRFNRFYLLIGLLAAYVIPLITVGYLEPVELAPVTFSGDSTPIVGINETNPSISIDYTNIAISVYLLICTIFLIRFFKNLSHFYKTLNESDITEYHGHKLALMNRKELPHTFFNYIFINKDDFINHKIDDDLLAHEITHASELHTVDVVLIEAFKILFWFNPILHFYKKALQLNHEFIADENVISKHGKTKEYQSLLLRVASGNKEIYLASNIHFSLTKKRLQMMTKSYSRWKAYVYAGLSVPLFVALFMCFGHYAVAQSGNTNKELKQKEKIFAQTTFIITDEGYEEVFGSFNEIPMKYKEMIPLPPPPPPLPGSTGVPKEVPPLKKGVIHFDVAKNSLRVMSGDNLEAPLPPPPPAPPAPPAAHYTAKASKAPKSPKAPKAQKSSKAPKQAVAPVPPPPPPAPDPIDMAVSIAKNGGSFMLNGKEVSSDDAIKVLKDIDNVATIDINHVNGKDVMKINTK